MTVNDNGNEVLRKAAEKVYPLEEPATSYYLKTKEIEGSPFIRDAFERFRISTPTDIFDHKNVYSSDSYIFKQKLEGTSSITYNSAEVATELSVGTAANDRAVRQSRHIIYTPGKSQIATITGVWGTGLQAGTVRRIGLFDDLNGLFLEINGEDLFFVVRSNVTGSVVDVKYSRDKWDDPLDGTGSSRAIIDFSKTQIFFIDYQWLGVGKVRFGFNIEGTTILALGVGHSNKTSTVYMQQASVPVRHEILNLVDVTDPSTIKEICMSVASEALTQPIGFLWHSSNLLSLRTVTTAFNPLIAIRLKNSFKGKPNRFTILLKKITFFSESENVPFVVSKVYSPSDVVGTWESVNDESAVEISRDITSYNFVVQNNVDCQVVTASSRGGLDNSGTWRSGFDLLTESTVITQNFDSDNSDLFVIRARTLSGSSNCFAAFTWYEVL